MEHFLGQWKLDISSLKGAIPYITAFRKAKFSGNGMKNTYDERLNRRPLLPFANLVCQNTCLFRQGVYEAAVSDPVYIDVTFRPTPDLPEYIFSKKVRFSMVHKEVFTLNRWHRTMHFNTHMEAFNEVDKDGLLLTVTRLSDGKADFTLESVRWVDGPYMYFESVLGDSHVSGRLVSVDGDRLTDGDQRSSTGSQRSRASYTYSIVPRTEDDRSIYSTPVVRRLHTQQIEGHSQSPSPSRISYEHDQETFYSQRETDRQFVDEIKDLQERVKLLEDHVFKKPRKHGDQREMTKEFENNQDKKRKYKNNSPRSSSPKSHNLEYDTKVEPTKKIKDEKERKNISKSRSRSGSSNAYSEVGNSASSENSNSNTYTDNDEDTIISEYSKAQVKNKRIKERERFLIDYSDINFDEDNRMVLSSSSTSNNNNTSLANSSATDLPRKGMIDKDEVEVDIEKKRSIKPQISNDIPLTKSSEIFSSDEENKQNLSLRPSDLSITKFDTMSPKRSSKILKSTDSSSVTIVTVKNNEGDLGKTNDKQQNHSESSSTKLSVIFSDEEVKEPETTKKASKNLFLHPSNPSITKSQIELYQNRERTELHYDEIDYDEDNRLVLSSSSTSYNYNTSPTKSSKMLKSSEGSFVTSVSRKNNKDAGTERDLEKKENKRQRQRNSSPKRSLERYSDGEEKVQKIKKKSKPNLFLYPSNPSITKSQIELFQNRERAALHYGDIDYDEDNRLVLSSSSTSNNDNISPTKPSKFV